MPEILKGLPVIAFRSDKAWESWLGKNGATSDGLWVKFAKKGNATPSVSKVEAIRTALCWGWIDGQLGTWDDEWFVTRFTPRRARSKWSKINIQHVVELEAEGRIRPAGKTQIDAAKADGRWDAAYSSAKRMKVPPELKAALEESPAAAKAFAQLDSANRYAMCYRIETAKREETKLRNAAKFVAMLECGERIH
jgi:uncharacterized protein YdeI (YjbR/CyaY-like superfamily)